MEEKFKWDKFVIDCFLCFGLMVVSSVGLIKPLYCIYDFFGKPLGLQLFKKDFYNIALELSVLSLIPFIIFIILFRLKMIQYQVNKSSFWFVFVLLTSFWWYLAYWLSHNFKVIS